MLVLARSQVRGKDSRVTEGLRLDSPVVRQVHLAHAQVHAVDVSVGEVTGDGHPLLQVLVRTVGSSSDILLLVLLRRGHAVLALRYHTVSPEDRPPGGVLAERCLLGAPRHVKEHLLAVVGLIPDLTVGAAEARIDADDVEIARNVVPENYKTKVDSLKNPMIFGDAISKL
jgi:hypothetical protein